MDFWEGLKGKPKLSNSVWDFSLDVVDKAVRGALSPAKPFLPRSPSHFTQSVVMRTCQSWSLLWKMKPISSPKKSLRDYPREIKRNGKLLAGAGLTRANSYGLACRLDETKIPFSKVRPRSSFNNKRDIPKAASVAQRLFENTKCLVFFVFKRKHYF